MEFRDTIPLRFEGGDILTESAFELVRDTIVEHGVTTAKEIFQQNDEVYFEGKHGQFKEYSYKEEEDVAGNKVLVPKYNKYTLPAEMEPMAIDFGLNYKVKPNGSLHVAGLPGKYRTAISTCFTAIEVGIDIKGWKKSALEKEKKARKEPADPNVLAKSRADLLVRAWPELDYATRDFIQSKIGAL